MEALQLEPGQATRDSIMERLTAESVAFKAINARVKRSEGLDAGLNQKKRLSLYIIDGLLGELNVVHLNIEDDDETTTGGWHNELHEPLDGRGQD